MQGSGGEGVRSFMFALEPSALLLTRVQNELKLDFESLRGDKRDKERTWKKAGSRRGSAACCLESWVLPTCLPATFLCLPSLLLTTLMPQGGAGGHLFICGGGKGIASAKLGAQHDYPKWGGLLVTTLSLGHKAGYGFQCQQGQEELSSPESECLTRSVFPRYTSATFFPCKDAGCNLQIHAGVEESLLWDLSSHQLNKSPTLFACRASTLPGGWLCWDARAASPGVDVIWEFSSGAMCYSGSPFPRSRAASLQGRSGTLLYI